MNKSKNIWTENIRMMTHDDLDLVRCWRNHESVRSYMYTNQIINKKEHLIWFEKTSANQFNHLLIFEYNQIPLGFVNFSNVRRSAVAEWGFYTSPDAPRGAGRRLSRAALRYAFEQLKLHKVSGQALANNEASIKFHLNAGFKQEGILRDQHFNGSCYQDVLCFGLLASEWQPDCGEI